MSSDTLDVTENRQNPPSQLRGPKTPLRLGDVVANLNDPAAEFMVLNAETRVPMPGETIRITNQEDFYPKLRNIKDIKVVHFARIRGLETQNIDGIPKSELKTLETQVFNPPRGYIDCCMDLEPVKAWRENNSGSSLSLITGLKTVREPVDSDPVAESRLGEDQDNGIDSVADPGKPAASNQGHSAAEQVLQPAGSPDLLLAYQVTRIRWRWKNKTKDFPLLSRSVKTGEDGNHPQVGSGECQETSGEGYWATTASPPRWVIFRRA